MSKGQFERTYFLMLSDTWIKQRIKYSVEIYYSVGRVPTISYLSDKVGHQNFP